MDEVSKAVELFRSGFMCSQTVFAGEGGELVLSA